MFKCCVSSRNFFFVIVKFVNVNLTLYLLQFVVRCIRPTSNLTFVDQHQQYRRIKRWVSNRNSVARKCVQLFSNCAKFTGSKLRASKLHGVGNHNQTFYPNNTNLTFHQLKERVEKKAMEQKFKFNDTTKNKVFCDRSISNLK